MASFSRSDYEAIFSFALKAYKIKSLRRDAVHTMWLVEAAIGQQSNFPDAARRDYPRATFNLPDWS
jgi:hypothetical protein